MSLVRVDGRRLGQPRDSSDIDAEHIPAYDWEN